MAAVRLPETGPAPIENQAQPRFGMSNQRVTIVQDSVVLPTAGMSYTDPHAPFRETGGYLMGCTYPNPFNTHFLREKLEDREYKRVVLENAYLRVEFTPEMGGRIWRLYDKVHANEAVHLNDSAKPYPGGFGGAYVAGGIELNFPFAHSVTNCWPRRAEVHANPDGSATYTVSEWERNGRLVWAMSFTLCPDEARLRHQVMFYNRNKLPSSYMYWGNAGVPIDLSSRWVYRETMGSEHGGSTVFYWPFYRGLQLDLYKDNPEVLGLYFLDPQYSFFGKIDTDVKKGLVHFASRYDVPGKKLWTWGRNFSGENRAYHLSKEPQYYGEVQSGRPVNQEHMEQVAPEEMIQWTEQWSPVYGLTNVTEMTGECAFQLLPDERKLLAYAVVPFQDRTLTCMLDGKPVKEISFSGSPAELSEIALAEFTAEQISAMEIRVRRGGSELGRIAVKGRCKVVSPKEIREEPVADKNSSNALTVWADFSAKLLYRDRALKLYHDAIDKDPNNAQAHLGLGRLLLFAADYEGAKAEFLKVIDLNKWEAEAYLMLSHIFLIQGDLDNANEYASWARFYGLHNRGALKVAEVAIAAGDFEKAVTFAQEALQYNGTSLRAYGVASLALRAQGKIAEASEVLASAPCAPLRDLMWHSELWLLGEATDAEFADQLFKDEWRTAELALNYTELGRYDEAGRIARFGIGFHDKTGWELAPLFNPKRMLGFTRKRECPFLHMILGYIADKQGRAEDAARHFADGDYFELHVNTNQLEMVPVLQMAIRYGCKYAHFYLGNFYYGTAFLPDAAAAEWRKALDVIPDCAQLLRNMASYVNTYEKDATKSRDLLRKAMALTPDDVYLLQQLVTVERACGATPDEILALYKSAPEAEKDQFLLNRGLLAAYIVAERFEEAVDYLASIDRSAYDEDSAWPYFCGCYGEWLLDHGKPAEALEWLRKSRPIPSNLSYANYTEESYPKHKEFYLSGLACRALGDEASARDYFQKAAQEPAVSVYFRPWEGMWMQYRFWVALALKELGLDVAAQDFLCCINGWRETQALVRLDLDRHEMKRWSETDPMSPVDVHAYAGPEI